MKNIFIFLVIFTIALTSSVIHINTTNTISIGSFSKFLPHIEIIEEAQNPISISFVGDVMLGRRVETYLNVYGSDYVYSSLPKLSSTTILVANFEAPIPKKHTQTPDLTFSFSVDAQHISAMQEYGFAYVGLANNHSYDKALDGFKHTKQVLNDNGIKFFGDPKILSTSSISYVKLKNKTVALIGIYAIEKNPNFISLEKLINDAISRSDIQVVYVHWGTEYKTTHSQTQENLAHQFVDLGVDIVIGHHPHVVQDIEMYKNVPIFYSLGNFIFDQYFSSAVQEGLWLTVLPEEGNITYYLQGITSIGSRSVPRFMSAYENDIFLKKIAKNSTSDLSEMIISGVLHE